MRLRRNILISSAGRRVSLLRAFERAAASVDTTISVAACDVSPLSAAFQAAAFSSLVPRCTDPSFIDAVLTLCDKYAIGLIVPTIDTELPVYAAAKSRFLQAGTTVAVSSLEAAQIGVDKYLTHEWLTRTGFPTVRQWTSAESAASSDATCPILAKPRFGSASIGIMKLESPDQLVRLDGETEYAFQEIARGREHTVDVLVLDGKSVSAVPRERLEVRAGEVSKGVTRRHAGLEALAKQIGESLPGAFGAINVQVFVDDDGRMSVIEINPRFGGGFPLSDAAGADFPRWLLENVLGLPSTATNTWRSDLVMLRFDEAVFLAEDHLVR